METNCAPNAEESVQFVLGPPKEQKMRLFCVKFLDKTGKEIAVDWAKLAESYPPVILVADSLWGPRILIDAERLPCGTTTISVSL